MTSHAGTAVRGVSLVLQPPLSTNLTPKALINSEMPAAK
jgi:hypothetical protein